MASDFWRNLFPSNQLKVRRSDTVSLQSLQSVRDGRTKLQRGGTSGTSWCVEFNQGSVTGDMCEDLCVHGLVEYKRCLYYENGKKVIEAHWRGNPVILKSKLENFSSYEPLGILDYQDAGEELSAFDVVFYATMEVRNSLGLSEDGEDEEGGGGNSSTLSRLWGKKLKIRERSYSRAELSSLWSLLQQEEYTFLSCCVGLQVVAIDVDMAFFEPKMRDILEQNCSSDDDCNFFDCSSRCDPLKHRCSPHRRNTNLQVRR
ncbi:PREDICTED: protein FAM69C-like [Cyprinodon variegatus]|uniref:protein FAM69C-like n=1 Tax=Cyprinodon variegatus TaxID=28743 RepID=UPI00074290C5|nr:PREDICTED: protein FAM69C-like [Cyprinodon variegatus]